MRATHLVAPSLCLDPITSLLLGGRSADDAQVVDDELAHRKDLLDGFLCTSLFGLLV